MRRLMMTTALAGAVMLAACGGGDSEAQAAAGAGSDAAAETSTQTPLFTEATLADLRNAGGASLTDALDFMAEECGSAALGFEPGAISATDFNGDGRSDFLIDMTGFTCGGENRASGWCGSGGCSFDVFVSTGDDFHQDSFLGMDPEIVRVGDRPAVSAAGRDGPWTVAWDGEAMSPVEATGSTASGGGANDEEAVRAVVASIYDTYVAGFDSGATFPEGVETAELRAAIEAASDPEMGGLGFDYYCACQDYGDVSYEMSGVAVNGDRATVAVDFRSYGRLTQLELRLRKVGGRWQVDDVIDPDGSLRQMLSDY